MLKSQIFHANAVDKLPKVREQMDNFLSVLEDDAVVSVTTTEIGSPSKDASYSYTVLVIYKSK
ncbi:MAG: hypothetical protein ACYC27_15520 [Armatimonadota bacterium]